jgi:hypothetical protein
VSNAAEKVENKVTTGVWEDNKDSDTKYPGCGAVNFALVSISGMEQVENKVSAATWDTDKTSEIKYPSCNAVNTAVAAASDAMEKTANKVTKAGWDSGKTDNSKYPSCAAIAQGINAVFSQIDFGIVTSVSAASTHAQLPTAKAVYSFCNSIGLSTERGSTVSGTQVTASSFQTIMGYCNGGSETEAANSICWYEAAQYCAYLTVASSDVPQAVKDHITRFYLVAKSSLNTTSYSQTNGDKCRNYLKYALITPKCYRLPTSEEWSAAYDAKTIPSGFWLSFNTSNENIWDWCLDGSGTAIKLGGKNIGYGAYNASRVVRGGPLLSDSYYPNNGRSSYYSASSPSSRGYARGGPSFIPSLGVRLARTT